MFSSKEILTTATVNKIKNTTATVTTATDNINIITTAVDNKKIDLALSDNSDLISPEFNGWYAKCIKQIGCNKFYELASLARQQGKNKSRYFSWLLKRAM